MLATVATLGLGLLSMGIGGALDNSYSERFMWLRIVLQAAAVVLIISVLVLTNT